MVNADSVLRTVPLKDMHKNLGARMVPFSGWEMPVQYEGIISEHQCVRNTAGLFDVSHMGRWEIRGKDAVAFVNYISINDVAHLEDYQSHYNAACYEHGGIVDDFLVYRCPDRILIVPNAGNRKKDMAWFQDHAGAFDIEIADLSDDTVLFALQGPLAFPILSQLSRQPLDDLGYQWFKEGAVDGVDARIFRTGYTGEDGFELWLPADAAERVWRAILNAGMEYGIKPCGLGARDTLRLEAGLCLYGHEIDETIHPLEARLGWITKLEKPVFIGRDALIARKEEGLSRRLIGIKLLERGIPRQGYEILHDEIPVGKVVSGSMSPMLGYGIGTGYVAYDLSKPGTDLQISIRGKKIPAKVARMPFYKSGSRK